MRNFVSEIRYRYVPIKKEEELGVWNSVRVPTKREIRGKLSQKFGMGTYPLKSWGTLSLRFGTGTCPLRNRRNLVSEIRYGYLPSKKLEELCRWNSVWVPTH
jgi:hypothetical protein